MTIEARWNVDAGHCTKDVYENEEDWTAEIYLSLDREDDCASIDLTVYVDLAQAKALAAKLQKAIAEAESQLT